VDCAKFLTRGNTPQALLEGVEAALGEDAEEADVPVKKVYTKEERLASRALLRTFKPRRVSLNVRRGNTHSRRRASFLSLKRA
jgi:hypothetical protein